MLSIHRIVNQPVSSNCFVLYDKAFGLDCLIVDPGGKSNEELLTFVESEDLSPRYIILTHEHFDHCWGVNELVERYQIPIVGSSLCAHCIRYEKKNCSVFYDFNERFVITSDTETIESLGYVLPFAGTELQFYQSLGHTDASICFLVDRFLFTGDTLIKDERTVTKLPTGSVEKLKQSLAWLETLKGQGLVVYPGHGAVFELDGYDLGKAVGKEWERSIP